MTARGKTTREFLKKKPRTAGIDSEQTSLTIKSDRLFTFSKPNIHYDHVFTQLDIEKLNTPILTS